MSARVFRSFYLIEIKKMLSYRADFWIGFVGNVLSQFGVAFFLWKAIFAARGVDRMEGYTFGGLMLYYLMVPLTERIVFGQDMGYMSNEIYGGGLSRYLLYPVSFFRIKYAGTLAQASMSLLQMLLTLSVFLLIFRRPMDLHWRALAMTLPVFALAGLLHFFLTACLEMAAFWADNVWSIMVFNRMITHLLGGGLIPLAFFPKGARFVLDCLPFPRVVSFPIRCLLGQVESGEWIKGMGMTAAWTLVFALIASRIWNRGLRGYSGVGI
jgi:ABC-2 type transport system permease protein